MMLVVPVALLGVLFDLVGLSGPARMLLELSATSMDLLLIALAAISDHVPLFHLPVPAPPVVLICGLGAVCVLLLPRGFRLRWLGGVWLLPLLLPLTSGPGAGALWLSVFDVGQGLAVLIRTRGHSLVYDTGPGWDGRWNAGARIIAPNLLRQGLRQLDRVLLSHRHLDHIGGTGGLIGSLAVLNLMTNVPRRFLPATSNGITTGSCQAGMRWRWDGYLFQILSPHPRRLPLLSVNNASCVLRVSGPGGAILLSGDIERQTEQALVRSLAPGQSRALESTVLLAPHHGSRTSSSGAFLRAVQPRWIVISRGYRNRFGFPHPEVMQRYRAQGSGILDTTCGGSLELRFNMHPQRLQVIDWRRRHARFWHVLDDGRCTAPAKQ